MGKPINAIPLPQKLAYALKYLRTLLSWSSKCFLQEHCSVSIYETYSIDLRKITHREALGAHVTLAGALKIILIILAVAAIDF